MSQKALTIFLSADIEGTAGIANWNETDKKHPDYPAFAAQMTREVAAACEGALAGGAGDILVRDAHDSARNIDGGKLPRGARLFRGWSGDPLLMMTGLDESFGGVMMTGYHSAAGTGFNPLSHTMDTGLTSVRLNGLLSSELELNALTASMLRVPLRLVTGDRGLCEWLGSINPNIPTVAAFEGQGGGVLAKHPDQVTEEIRDAARGAMALDASLLHFPMPEFFSLEIRFQQIGRAHV